MSLRSVDNLVSAVENQQLESLGAKTSMADLPPETEIQPVNIEAPESEAPKEVKEEVTPLQEEKPQVSDEKPVEKTETTASETDDYGNPVPKPRTYTEEEVQRMIRDRLSRGHAAQQPVQPEIQQPTQPVNQGTGEDWEVQLESFIENTVQKLGTKRQQEQAQQREQQLQAEFEVKFNMGMSKFPDFKDTVMGKPITDAMMVAARNMKDPAAFIYAASKNYAADLQKIAQLPDAYAQAAEIGRLEERMKKAKNVTSAPPPIKTVGSDVGEKVVPKKSIDNLIHDHAKRKFRR